MLGYVKFRHKKRAVIFEPPLLLTPAPGANFENRAVIGLAGFPTSPTQFLDRDQPQGF
jgi:hypothetical protein